MLEAIEKFWVADRIKHFTSLETRVFFYLVWLIPTKYKQQPAQIPTALIVAKLKISPAKLKAARIVLSDAGLIQIKIGSTREANEYTIIGLNIDEYFEAMKSIAQAKKGIQGGDKRTYRGEQTYLQGGTNVPNQPDNANIELLPAEFRPVVNHFLVYLSGMNKPLKTEAAIIALFNKLNELSGGDSAEAERIVNYAIQKNWLSVYPVPGKPAIKKSTQTLIFSSDL